MSWHLLVEVDAVGHVVDVFEDLVEAELVLDDAFLRRFHERNADNLESNS
jgi:hypothetical protein